MSDAQLDSTKSKATFEGVAANSLYAAIRDTARSRFVAAKRLADRDVKIVRITSFASGFLIINAILPYFFSRDKFQCDVLNVSSVLLAITILISTLLQYARLDGISAEQHHRCGLELNETHREMLGLSPKLSNAQYRRFCEKYNYILQKYSINHETIDYQSVMLDRLHEHPSLDFMERQWMRVRIMAKTRTPDIVLMFVFIGGIYTSLWFFNSPEYQAPVNSGHVNFQMRIDN